MDCKAETHYLEVTKLNETLQQTETEKNDLNVHIERVYNSNNVFNLKYSSDNYFIAS